MWAVCSQMIIVVTAFKLYYLIDFLTLFVISNIMLTIVIESEVNALFYNKIVQN